MGNREVTAIIRLAVMDCGDRESEYLAVARRLRRARFTAAVSPASESARQTAEQLGIPRFVGSLDELLEHHAEQFDAVLLEGNSARLEQDCRRAAEAGKHLLVNSPFELTHQTAANIAGVCRQSGVVLMLGQTSRFLPAFQTVKLVLDAGKLGEPGLLRIHRWDFRSAFGSLEDFVPDLCERSLAARLVPDIDLAIWFFGTVPDHVYAVGSGPSDVRARGGDYVQVHLGFPHGGMALLDFTDALPDGESYYSLSLIGSAGAAYADDHHNMQLLYRGGPPRSMKSGIGPAAPLAKLQEFVDSIVEHRLPACPAEAICDAFLVADAAIQSMESGRALQEKGNQYELA
jgi:predicted dehydrogenase